MALEIKGVEGDTSYIWYQLARGTETGHSVEYDQFIERFLQGDGDPNNSQGVQGSFYVNTSAMTLHFRQSVGDNDPDSSNAWIQIASGGGGGGGGTALTVSDADTDISNTSDINFEDAYWNVTVGDTSTTADVSIADATAMVPGLMTGAQVTKLADIAEGAEVNVQSDYAETDTAADSFILNKPTIINYDLTLTNNGSDDRVNPSDLDFRVSSTSLRAFTEGDNELFNFTPVDAATGDFSEETIVFGDTVDNTLADGGESGATISGFVGGIDGASVVLKNGVALQRNPVDYEFTNTTIKIFGRSYNGDEITVINGGTLTTVTGATTFTNSVTFNEDLTVVGDSNLNTVTVTGDSDFADVDISGDLSVAGVSTFGDADAGGGAVTIHGALNTTDSNIFGGTVTINDTLSVPSHLTTLHSATVNGVSALEGNVTVGTTDTNSDLTVNGDLTVTGTSDLAGDVEGRGFVNAVVEIADEHGGGSGSIHVHGTASTTDPVDFVDPPGDDNLLSYLFESEPDDFNDSIDYYTYDDTMTWRFLGSGAPTTDQFIRGNYYATSEYFPTSGGTLTTEVASDIVQSGEWLLLCTGVTQEPRNGRLIVSFRVITNGIDVTTSNEWLNRPSGSSQYVINPTNFDRTAASRYNLINVSLSNSGIVTQADNGDFITATSEDVYNAIAAGSDEGRRHILNELSGISGIPNSTVTATRDGVTWYSEGRGYTGATAVEASFATFGVVAGSFFMEVVAIDEDLSLVVGQMAVFTIGTAEGLPTGINPNTTYTATIAGIGGTAAIPFVTLSGVVANGTSNTITPDVAGHITATDVVLQVYHAQLNEEYIIDPLDLIDSVDEMTAAQKTELRDAARVNFRNRVEIARVFNEDGTEIPDIGSFPGSGENVIVMIRASGVSGVTELVIDFDGNLGRAVTDTDILTPLNTGDDVDLEITVPLSTIPGGYVATTEVDVELIGASSDVELEIATLGDLIGAGRTIEDADLVVTPSRVESAIHNMDVNALADVRDAINSPDTFLELTDTPNDFTDQGGMVVQVNTDGDALIFGPGGDASSLSAAGYEWDTAETTDPVPQPILILRETAEAEADQHEVVRFVRNADNTYDIIATGNVRAG